MERERSHWTLTYSVGFCLPWGWGTHLISELTALQTVKNVHTLWPATPPLEIYSKKKPKFAQRFTIYFEDLPWSIIYSNGKGGEDYLKAQQYSIGLIKYSSSLWGSTKHPLKASCGKTLSDMGKCPLYIKWGKKEVIKSVWCHSHLKKIQEKE